MTTAVSPLVANWQALAKQAPDHEALVTAQGRYTRQQLAHHAQGLAAALQQAGIRPGDRVAMLLGNSLEAACAIMGCLLLGAVFMPLHPRMAPAKRLQVLQHTEPTAVLWHADHVLHWERGLQSTQALLPGLRGQWVAGTTAEALLNLQGAHTWPTGRAEALAAHAMPPDALTAVMHTSGSTGQPKGVMWSRGNLDATLQAIQGYLPLTPHDVIHCALPLSFGYGLYQLLQAFTCGARLVLEADFAFPARVMATLAREQVTLLPLVPTMLALLLHGRGQPDAPALALHTITCAGAALDAGQRAALAQRFPQARIVAMYGQTECQRISQLPPHEAVARPQSVGRGLPELQWWLQGEDGQRLALVGSEGELIVSGPLVMQGYWRAPEETAQALQIDATTGQRVLRTGDLFRTDDQGWLHFVGRRDEVFKSRGEKVAPAEVERAIARLPGVQEVAVKAVPDAVLGHAVLACVVRAPGAALSARQVLLHCRRELEQHQVPKWVQFANQLPKTESGKIQRAALPDPAPDSPRDNDP